ncbi:MAG TPA: hypothetical protein VFH30_08395 [Acidimicrobiales bacterium]|nr:hypothetical protein [Acidimicrobiales bacterium]
MRATRRKKGRVLDERSLPCGIVVEQRLRLAGEGEAVGPQGLYEDLAGLADGVCIGLPQQVGGSVAVDEWLGVDRTTELRLAHEWLGRRAAVGALDGVGGGGADACRFRARDRAAKYSTKPLFRRSTPGAQVRPFSAQVGSWGNASTGGAPLAEVVAHGHGDVKEADLGAEQRPTVAIVDDCGVGCVAAIGRRQG